MPEVANKSARWFLAAGAVLLIITALFHSSGLSMVAGWLPGMKGEILSLLWLTPVADWGAIGLLWGFIAFRPAPGLRVILLISAIVPAFAAVGLFVVAGASHPGPFMLAAATVLALIGTWRLR